ncbi:MAG: sigma-54-dependent Fis family transcriptional regulator [Peptococcaceae bacterium]|nr:sigma-54-dependent Fis family transcriptional regulator [Peptococcaceae bacterium]
MSTGRIFGDSELGQEHIHTSWKRIAFQFEPLEGVPAVRPVILDSWHRCRELNVKPFQKEAPLVLQGEELATYRQNYREMISIALPVMENMYRFVAEGGFIVILADPAGMLLEVLGDDRVKAMVEKGHFMPGADWSEEGAGTNAVGTSLKLDQPLQVAGYEHFCIGSHQWTCSSAVIHGPDGEQAGVIDITGPIGKSHSHTLGMVVTAANAIEAQLKLNRTMRSLELSNVYKNTIIESISQGLLAVDSAGYITQINRAGAEILGLDVEGMLNRPCHEVLGQNAAAIVNIVNSSKYLTDKEITLQTGSRKQSYLLTSRPIRGTTVWGGTVLLFNEIARARKLVQFMSGSEAKLTFEDLVGRDKGFLESVKLARSVADSTSSVLLLGESGTGKDMFAQAIHNASSRKQAPFIVINCGAIPRELVASELFGYAEGAFTGAKRGGKPGKFELANGGTIFLDEIGEMPLELQIILLRAIENKVITRVGGNEAIPVDVRIIAATNKSIEDEVRKGAFRLDLFYRLNVVVIKMIPLRERKDDIILFTEHFLQQLSVKLNKRPISRPDGETMKILSSHSWPGNVRELQNFLERAVYTGEEFEASLRVLPSADGKGNCLQEHSPVDKYESELIKDMLARHKGNVTRVAAELGVARTTVYRKMAKYGL